MNYDELDPGIRDTVRLLRDAGFETSDSGDGLSKPVDQIEIPFPHVAAAVQPDELHHHAYRMMAVLGSDWDIEATFFPKSGTAILLATRPLAATSPATEVSSAPAASPAQKSNSNSVQEETRHEMTQEKDDARPDHPSVISDPDPRGEEKPRSIYQKARDAACFVVWRATDVNLSAGHERLIRAAVDATLIAVSEHCERRSDELWVTGDSDNRNYAAAYATLQDWCADQVETDSVSPPRRERLNSERSAEEDGGGK